jgi:hypothetical protein
MRRWIVPDAVLCGVGPGRSVVGSRRREVDVAALVACQAAKIVTKP